MINQRLNWNKDIKQYNDIKPIDFWQNIPLIKTDTTINVAQLDSVRIAYGLKTMEHWKATKNKYKNITFTNGLNYDTELVKCNCNKK